MKYIIKNIKYNIVTKNITLDNKQLDFESKYLAL